VQEKKAKRDKKKQKKKEKICQRLKDKSQKLQARDNASG
jgi:hypothetical protein